MANAEMLGYVGAVTGVLGACTGIFGAVMGVVAYRRAGALKAIDLRLELRRLDSDLQRAVEGLPGQLAHAKRSREAVNSAKGMYQSGAMKGWHDQWEIDLAAANELPQQLPCLNFDFDAATHKELEQKLVEVHTLRAKADALVTKYQGSLEADDRDRDHLMADRRARTGQPR